MKNTYFLIALVIATLFIASCSGSRQASTAVLSYSGQVKAIIDANCANTCHNATRPAAGIGLTTYEEVKNQTLQGALIPAIKHEAGVTAMPKKADKLDDATIQVIVDWAAAGAIQ